MPHACGIASPHARWAVPRAARPPAPRAPGARRLRGDPQRLWLDGDDSAVVTSAGDEYAARPASVGRPNLTADLRITGAGGQPLPAGQVGELCFRSPQVAKGYWKDQDATKAAFADGWFRIGDLGYIDADGYVYVVDRLKDVVIRGGENVYCAEVEAVLFEHPAVADVTVIACPTRPWASGWAPSWCPAPAPAWHLMTFARSRRAVSPPSSARRPCT